MISEETKLKELDVEVYHQNQIESKITIEIDNALLKKKIELDYKRIEKLKNELKKLFNVLKSNENENDKTKVSNFESIKTSSKKDLFEAKKKELLDIQKRIFENEKNLEENTKNKSINQDVKCEEILINQNFTETKKKLLNESESFFLKKEDNISTVSSSENDEIVNNVVTKENPKKLSIVKKKRLSCNYQSDDLDYNEDAFVKKRKKVSHNNFVTLLNIDDGNEDYYQKRLSSWQKKKIKEQKIDIDTVNKDDLCFMKHPDFDDEYIDDNFKLPGEIYSSLFNYQKTCLKWLWELYTQKTGGILGDEMGLGKTIQIVSFISGLHYSKLLNKPALIVVPATLLIQWLNEFHKWWPPLRCVILHGIGSAFHKNSDYMNNNYESLINEKVLNNDEFGKIKNQVIIESLLNRIVEKGHVLITTYVGLLIYSKYILTKNWGYVVLDEGHKIRNPDLKITLTCKQLKSVNRIILSGTPIQNNLVELWSLFDFIFPGRLGTLPVFQSQFSIPINMGGYLNASNLQFQAGYKCATILKDLISPYLLIRLKKNVAKDLPKKEELVLFVKLSDLQKKLYQNFLSTFDLVSVLKKKKNILSGIDVLKKICNHVDLTNKKTNSSYNDHILKSGKFQVIRDLLLLWKDKKHKTLLFSQTKQMLNIIEDFILKLNFQKLDIDLSSNNESYKYLRLDGSTIISKRIQLISLFNTDPNIKLFLLTTRVGGLGLNLTSADRVIIYDPDWNPSTDIQARERVWRFGQKNDVFIYRLITAGTIEEKIYHRQIFKTLLTKKILSDPNQKRYFKINDLYDLFTLGDQDNSKLETTKIFNDSEQKLSLKKTQKKFNNNVNLKNNHDDFYEIAQINNLKKLDFLNNNTNERNSKDESPKEEQCVIMSKLLQKSSLHSTFKHDELINPKNLEFKLIEKEAEKIANDAAEMLKLSWRSIRNKNIDSPTWTGKSGFEGSFVKDLTKKNNSSLNSGSILSRLKEINENKNSISKIEKTTVESVDENKKDQVLDTKKILNNLINFLRLETDKFSSSNNILVKMNFSSFSESNLILIRSLLKQIADWDSQRKGWKLKEEYL